MPTRFAVTAEEIITTFGDPNNGSGPMWCFGSRTIARDGNRVFVTVPEVGKDARPLCNTRWQLFCREDGASWQRVHVDPTFDEREPCPLVRLGPGRIIVSVNPAQSVSYKGDDGRDGFNCIPQLLEFSAAAPQSAPKAFKPVWDKPYKFTEHSYRAISADPHEGEILLFNADGMLGQAWSFLDKSGQWTRQGELKFPVRGCYLQVALRRRATYVMAVSDIIEPNPRWRAFKEKVTGQKWDYEFRQLYFTWTPDVTTTEFSPPLTVASRDETAGLIRNLDLWVGPDGDAHLLYTDRNVWHNFMRNEFFPGLPIEVALKYARIRKGEVADRKILAQSREAVREEACSFEEKTWRIAQTVVNHTPLRMRDPVPDWAQFHATPDGALFAVYHLGGKDDAGTDVTDNYVLQLLPEGDHRPVRLGLKHPMKSFFLTGERTGSEPSERMDICGICEEGVMRYGQVRVGRE